MKSEIKLAIEGMHCGACVRRVTTALQSVPGVTVESVEIGSAKIMADPEKASAEAVTSALGKIGFQATATGSLRS